MVNNLLACKFPYCHLQTVLGTEDNWQNNTNTLFANFRPRGLYQAKSSMTQYINCTVSSNFLLDKGRVAENLQKECLLLFCYIFYFPMEEPIQPYEDDWLELC